MSPCFREVFHYLRKPICFWTLDIFQIVVSVETFLSCRMTCSVKKQSQIGFLQVKKKISPGKISEVTFLFWQQMAVFSGTVVMYLLATKESHTVSLSNHHLQQDLVCTGALGRHRIFCNMKKKRLEWIVPLLENFRHFLLLHLFREIKILGKLNLLLIKGKTSFVHRKN